MQSFAEFVRFDDFTQTVSKAKATKSLDLFYRDWHTINTNIRVLPRLRHYWILMFSRLLLLLETSLFFLEWIYSDGSLKIVLVAKWRSTSSLTFIFMFIRVVRTKHAWKSTSNLQQRRFRFDWIYIKCSTASSELTMNNEMRAISICFSSRSLVTSAKFYVINVRCI